MEAYDQLVCGNALKAYSVLQGPLDVLTNATQI
jgi:hypothetical protein